MPNTSRNNLSIVIFAVFLLLAVGILVTQVASPISSWFAGVAQNANRPTVEISVIYSSEMKDYLDQAMQEFNDSYDRGINPVTGEKLKNEDKKFKVTGKDGPTGTTKDNILNALNNVNTDKKATPTIFAPSSRAWLNLINFESGQNVFADDNIRPTSQTPVGIAVWESRLRSLQAKYPGQEIGFEQIRAIQNLPNGWQDIDPKINRKSVYYGMTNPLISSTANSTIIAQYYGANQALGKKTELLSKTDAQDPAVQNIVRTQQELIRHYAANTIVFRDYIGRGPEYIDMVPLPENDVAFINRGKGTTKPPEKLVMLYPKEGSIIHEHLLATLNAPWVNDEQKQAAKVFGDYVASTKIQERVRDLGFRPANSEVGLNSSQMQADGLDAQYPKNKLAMPSGETISQLQLQWDFVKKTANVVMLMDTSGSMQGPKIENAKKALDLFTQNLGGNNNLGLTDFNTGVNVIQSPKALESIRPQLQSSIAELNAQGSTALYDGIINAVDQLAKNPNAKTQIQAIVILSDGQDTSSQARLQDVVNRITKEQEAGNQILVMPVAYGSDADQNSLNAIARASKTTVQNGDTADIQALFNNISSYF